MKRIITLVLVFCLALSVCSCNVPNEKTENQNNKEIIENDTDGKDNTIYPIQQTLTNSIKNSNFEVFKGKVISKSEEHTGIEFPTISHAATATLYEVEVTEVIRTYCVAEKIKIYIARYSNETGIKPYEIGKEYVIAGSIQFYNEKPVVADVGELTFELCNDGKIIPISTASEKFLKDISDYDSFIKHKDVVEGLKKEDGKFPYQLSIMHTLIDTSEITDSKISKNDAALKLIREAFPIDSKKTIKLLEK